MTFVARLLVLSFAVIALATAAGQDLPPDQLVNKITADVLAAIHQDRELRAGDRAKALALAEEKVLPYIDFTRMTQLAMGRSWRAATPDQREMLVREFRGLLIRTYSNAIRAYEGQTLLVEPLRMTHEDTDVRVRSKYLQPGIEPVPVEYAMWKTPEGWQVYDISVEGVSLVTTYRGSFDEEIKRSGIDGLIARLREKNQQLGASVSGSQPGL